MDTAGRSDRSLRRIVAVLVALAVLAERTAGRPFPVRWFVLALLRHAEAVARDFVQEETGCEWPGLGEAAGLPYGPADAIHLAAQFRALAAALLPTTPLFPGGSHTVGSAAHLSMPPAVSAIILFGEAGRAYDTS